MTVSKKTAKEANETEFFDIEEATSPLKLSSKKHMQESDTMTEVQSISESVSREQGYIFGPMKKIPSRYNHEIEMQMNLNQNNMNVPI